MRGAGMPVLVRRLSVLVALLALPGLLGVPAASAAVSAGQTSGSIPSAPAVAGSKGAGFGAPVGVPAGTELIGLRTATSKTFVAQGGMLEARIFSQPVHFADGQGGWADIDNRVRVDAAAGGFVNGPNRVRVVLPAQAGGPVRIADGQRWVSFRLDGAFGVGVPVRTASGIAGGAASDGDTVRYEGALPGVALELTPTAAGVKELVSLASAAAQPAGGFGYRLQLSPGLSAAVDATGGLVVSDAAGGRVFGFAAPWAQDSSGRPTGLTMNVGYALRPAAGGYALSMTVDPAWLNDPARVFPVRVDPTNVGVDVAQNTFISAQDPTTSYGTSDLLRVGTSAGLSRRSLLRFDTSVLPRDAEMISSVMMVQSLQTATVPISVHRMTATWTGSASWTYSGTGGPWATGGSFDAAEAYTTSHHTAADVSWFTISRLVKGWVDGSIVNDGVLLKAVDEASAPLLDFASSRSATPPYLSVNYTQRTGDRPFYTYLSRQVDDRTSLKVNVTTGNAVLAGTDARLGGAGLDLVVSRTYNSRGEAGHSPGALPRNWTLGSSSDVTAGEYFDGILYTGPDGQNAWFARTAKNADTFITPPGSTRR